MSQESVRQDNNFLFSAMKHWPIVIAFASLFISWGIFSNRISTIEAQVDVLKVQNDKNTDNVTDVKVTLGEIKTSLEFIKEKLNAGGNTPR